MRTNITSAEKSAILSDIYQNRERADKVGIGPVVKAALDKHAPGKLKTNASAYSRYWHMAMKLPHNVALPPVEDKPGEHRGLNFCPTCGCNLMAIAKLMEMAEL